jgi:hypothetical protein
VIIAKAKVGFIEPMLALAVTKLPEGPAWTYTGSGFKAIPSGRNGNLPFQTIAHPLVCHEHARRRLARDRAAGLKVCDDRGASI